MLAQIYVAIWRHKAKWVKAPKCAKQKHKTFTHKTITTSPTKESVIVCIYIAWYYWSKCDPAALPLNISTMYHYYRHVLEPQNLECVYIYWIKCDPAALIYIIIGLFLITNIFMYYSKCDPAALIHIIIGLLLITNIFMYYSKCHPAALFYLIIGHNREYMVLKQLWP